MGNLFHPGNVRKGTMKKLIALSLLTAATWGQTLTLSLAGPTTFKAAGTVVLNLTLTGSAGQNVSGIQFTIPAPGGVTTAILGAASTAATKNLTCSQSSVAPLPVTCIIIGSNNTAYADGVVAVISVVLPNPIVQGLTWTMPVISASTTGTQVATVSSAPNNPCNITGSGTVGVGDITAAISSALTQTACVDLNGDGTCNIMDVIRVVIAGQPAGVCKIGV
jgi:hypothetical protein